MATNNRSLNESRAENERHYRHAQALATEVEADTRQVLDTMQLASCEGLGLLFYQHRAGYSLSTRTRGSQMVWLVDDSTGCAPYMCC